MIKWIHFNLMGNFPVIHSDKIKDLDWGYFEILVVYGYIKVYIRESGDFRLDDGELQNIEDAKRLCEDYLSKVIV